MSKKTLSKAVPKMATLEDAIANVATLRIDYPEFFSDVDDDVEWAYNYCRDILEDISANLEPLITTVPYFSFCYAHNVITDKRFLGDGEECIAQCLDGNIIKGYMDYLEDLPGDKLTPFLSIYSGCETWVIENVSFTAKKRKYKLKGNDVTLTYNSS